MKQLQAMMRHVSSQTTEGYIQYAQSAKPQAVDIHIPSGLVGMGWERDSGESSDLT